MTKVKAFRALRPITEFADQIAALPYDVMNSEEARVMVKDKPLSFLHVDKAEIDLDPSVDIYDDAVYEKARTNFASLRSSGKMLKDEKDCYYIYRLTMGGRLQTGIVTCPAVDDYLNNSIKKHELTRADKEADRIRHVDTLDANTGPIFLAHRPDTALSSITAAWISAHETIFSFTAGDVKHEGWIIDNQETIAEIASCFERISALYIADGHHRCASAVRVAQKRREANPGYTGDEEFNYFLAVIFPSDQLSIFDYNRLVKDLNTLSETEFLERISSSFDIEEAQGAVKPPVKHEFGLYMKSAHLKSGWRRLRAKKSILNENDPVEKLDVSILQNHLLKPILDIDDPRTNKRIDFVGGIRGLNELERRVNADMTVAFSMYPTTLDELMDIADAGKIMPPKSTWFEPKLLSGLFIHDLS
ncbi:MAG: DUF1015 family protein [Treponema sp.]|jgi:uncharacterized protein (DUF1015 family)|nr:DUF1015 family protein [Treponema sp.]